MNEPAEARGKALPRPGFDPWSAAAYLFDIDGTLLNTQDAVHYFAFNAALSGLLGRAVTIDGIAVHGNTDLGILRAALLRQGVAAAAIDAQMPWLLARLVAEVERNHAAMRPVACAGIAPLLQTLSVAGKVLGVASGNLERIGWMKVEKAGLREYFQFGAFSDGRERRADIFRHGIAEARRRLTPKALVAVVGDTPADILAAREAGAPVIALATGIYSLEELQQLQPDVCVSGCADLLAG